MNCSCLSVHSSSPVHLQATINLKRKKQQIISVELAGKAGKGMGRVSERYLTRTFINVCEDIFHYHILPRLEKNKEHAVFSASLHRAPDAEIETFFMAK